MRHGFLASLVSASLVFVFAAVFAVPRQAGAADTAVQYVQVSTHTAVTMNGQTIDNARDAKKFMAQQMGKGMMAGMVQSLIGSALQSVLSAVNPILGLAAQAIAAKAQQRLAASQTMKIGVTEVHSEAVTTTVSAQRRRIDDGNITFLVQCDLGRLVTIDNSAHTYSVKTFDELAAEGAAAVASDATGKDAVNPDCKAPTATVEHTSDDQTDTIADMTAHHKIETTTFTYPPGCFPKSNQQAGMPDMSQMKWTTERWYAPTDIPNQCSMPIAGLDRDSQAPATFEIPLRIIRKLDLSGLSQMQSQLQEQLKDMPDKSMIQNSGVLDLMSHLSNLVTFTTETQSAKHIPFDPSSFDVPAGFTQVESGATPPPALRQSL